MGQHKRGTFEERKQKAIENKAKLEKETLALEEEAKRKAQEWWAGLSEEDREKEILKEKKYLEFRRMMNMILHPAMRL